MALKFVGSKGTVEVKPGKGRMRNRHCVMGKKKDYDPNAKSIKNRSPLIMGGCFNSKPAAVDKAKKLAGK